MGSKQPMGNVEIPLSDLSADKPVDKWYILKKFGSMTGTSSLFHSLPLLSSSLPLSLSFSFSPPLAPTVISGSIHLRLTWTGPTHSQRMGEIDSLLESSSGGGAKANVTAQVPKFRYNVYTSLPVKQFASN